MCVYPLDFLYMFYLWNMRKTNKLQRKMLLDMTKSSQINKKCWFMESWQNCSRSNVWNKANLLLTFRTVLTWWGSNTLPLREVTMTRPYLPGVCKSEYSVCLDRFTGNKLSTKFPSIFARLCLGANRYSTFSSMRYLLKLAPSRIEISTGAEAKNTGWLATKWPSLWNDVLSPSCNTCRNILECSNSARAMNQHQNQRSGASVFNPRSWITEMMKRCVEYHQVLLGQRHLVSTALLFTSKREFRIKMHSKLYNV